MNIKKTLLLAITHTIVGVFGFAAGIYALPILIAPDAPDQATVVQAAEARMYSGTFSRDRADSDAFHWGEGEISIGEDQVVFQGKLSPGPDYKLYLSPEYLETESDFERLSNQMVRVGDIKTFENFILPIDKSIDPSQYTAAIVWCETFGEFITSATYNP